MRTSPHDATRPHIGGGQVAPEPSGHALGGDGAALSALDLLALADGHAVAGRVEHCRAALARAREVVADGPVDAAWGAQVDAAEVALRVTVDGCDGDVADATELLRRPGLPDEARGRLVTALLGRRRDAAVARDLAGGSAPASDPRDVRVRLLGGLDAVRGGAPLRLAGRPAELVAHLALSGRPVAADQVIEDLWPDAAPGRGRQRLRTVRARLRRDAGDLVERVGDQLRLHPDVATDVAEFRRLASEAHGSGDGVRAAGSALTYYRGDAAPALSPTWILPMRRQLRDLALSLHDLVAARAEEAGRIEDALRALAVAIELEPTDEHRSLVAARLQAQRGRPHAARDLLARCRVELRDAGLPSSLEHARLDGYLLRVIDGTVRAHGSPDGRPRREPVGG